MQIDIARIYDEAQPAGFRVLIDRLWPRGISKARAALDLWAKDIAPSSELRTWFGHDPARFEEFSVRYTEELNNNPAFHDFITEIRRHQAATLLYAAHDPKVNHALVLQQYLQQRLK